MHWRFGLGAAACLMLLAGCSDGSKVAQQLDQCRALPGAWDKLAEDWDDFFLTDCMQKSGYVVDIRLEAKPGVLCGQRDDPDFIPVCYRRDNWFAAWYARVAG